MIKEPSAAQDQSSQRALTVGIVGGGIGGMAAAAVLRTAGVEVAVFEQAREIGEIGAGIGLTPNSVRLLCRLPGIRDQIDRLGARYGSASAYRRKDGAMVAPLLIADSTGAHGSYGMHRADLLGMLASLVPPASIRTDSRCTAVDASGQGPVVHLQDGTAHRFDAVIGADGIHSVVRRFVAGNGTIEHSGVIAYRGLVDMARLPGWPTDASDLWMGEGKHFLTYPVRAGSLLNYVGFVPSGWDAPESWSAAGDVDELRAAFAGWDPRIGALLDQVDSTFWWSLNDRPPLHTWTRGSVALLGDAAHPMLPHLGQGANQAIEDAFVLAQCFATRETYRDIAALLADYERQRRPRATEIQHAARVTGHRFDAQGDFTDPDKRDAEMTDLLAFRTWIFDYEYPTVPSASTG